MQDLNALSLPVLFAELTKSREAESLTTWAMREDLDGQGDVTSACMMKSTTLGKAHVVARQDGVVAGMATLPIVLRTFGGSVAGQIKMQDGERCKKDDVLATLHGPLVAMLTLERTLLNLIGRLSGIATATARYVQAVAGTQAKVCDTRKTTPGMRNLEKYAVRCGGGWMHRMGLYDAMLIKDNHIAHIPITDLASTLTQAITAARSMYDLRFVEVEVDRLEQLEIVLELESGLVDMVLLDNMDLTTMRQAVALRNATAQSILLEASGGVTLDTIRSIAETGVDRISVGAITHSAPCMDVALDVVGD